MRVNRRIAVAAREAKRFAAIVAMRAASSASIHKQRASFRPLTEAETEALLGGELLAALSAPTAEDDFRTCGSFEPDGTP